MKYPPFRLIPALAAAAVLVLGIFWMAGRADSQQPDVRLPNGKLQRDEVLKAEHEANLKDAGRLVEMAEQLQQEIEKNDRYVLSIASLKKTDEIESLVKKIRSRLRHY